MTNQADILSKLFSDYRAEWPQDLFGSLFVRPAYMDKLVVRRPCFLIGGRGTGKTTSLKSLRFDSMFAQLSHGQTSANLPYFGIYLRINKNRVSAFQGEELTAKDWNQAFVHYFNLLACQEMCALSVWLENQGLLNTNALILDKVAKSLGIEKDVSAVEALETILAEQIVQLELFVNNPKTAGRPLFSMSEAPLKYFVESLKQAGYLKDRDIFCCLDEYENLTAEQQSIINTYLKHSEPPFTYKIGVRRNGLKTRSTIDNNDQISTPDDFSEIDIAVEDFELFACDVVEIRLRRAREHGVSVPYRISEFLAEMDFTAEANLLGASRIAEKIRDEINASSDESIKAWMRTKPDEELYFIGYWRAGHKESTSALAKDWMKRPDSWKTRFGNYGHASLFWLSCGRKGARIRKYYAGVNTFLSISSGNIRYFLELIDESIQHCLEEHQGVLPSPVVISGEAQTAAARSVGRRRLGQLEGLSNHGVDLKRFVLAIGKVFFEFARDPAKAPETNAFVVSGERIARAEVEEILRDGVAHLAFEATPRTKATSTNEMRDEEYRIHPIYAAFFEFSYRRKRRTTFTAEDLLLLREKPKSAISKLLGKSPEFPLSDAPAQLQMFAQFYEGGDE